MQKGNLVTWETPASGATQYTSPLCWLRGSGAAPDALRGGASQRLHYIVGMECSASLAPST
eukprot:12899822-Prorocentrum_lima.AAC.1